MSSRALRKILNTHEKDKSKVQPAKDIEESAESDDNAEEIAPKNKFDLLEEEETVEVNDDEDQEELNVIQNNKKKANKKKKKKGKKDNLNAESKDNSGGYKFITDEFDNLDLQKNQSTITSDNGFNSELFRVEAKYLNSENEMKRMFGAKVINSERNQRVQRGNKRVFQKLVSKNSLIVSSKPTWPEFRRCGLNMRILNESNNVTEFTFEHAPEYQRIQFDFLDAVDSYDHNNIINVLHTSPYHIDSLIQLSDVCRIQDDTNMAADLIERAIFAFQSILHPSLNLQKNNYKIDYNRVENRGFFIAIFKHLMFVGGKACYRTSLELCKLLLSLDVDGDPLGVILMIDFYALRAKAYKYLIDFYENFNATKHLSLLPNISMSIALAYYYYSKESNNEEYYRAEADRLLKEALVKFPGLLLPLLDKCNVVAEKAIENHKFFARTSHLSEPEGLGYLFKLYMLRMNYEWKLVDVISWLENNIMEMIKDEKRYVNSVNDYKAKFNAIFAVAPSNVLRHLILCDSKEIALALPRELSSTASYTFDPVPPRNTIRTYQRPERPPRVARYANDASLLTFFRSLLPNFNSQDQVAAGEAQNENNLNPGDRVRELINRLTEMLNIQIPVNDQQNENNQNQNGDESEEDYENYEFD